jgi:hypothetical protein
MDAIRGNADFKKWLGHNKKLSPTDLLQQTVKFIRDNNGKVAYIPFGKLFTKVGEVAKENKDEKIAEIIKKSPAIQSAIKNKNDEGKIVSKVHHDVVGSISQADAAIDYEGKSEGINGPHTKAYLTNVLHSMHFDMMVTNYDGYLGIVTGARNSTPGDFRECIQTLSGFKNNPNKSEAENRSDLNNWLIQRSKIRASDNAIEVNDGTNKYTIALDTWRSAGTTQKVEKKLGDSLTACIRAKTDNRRASKNSK